MVFGTIEKKAEIQIKDPSQTSHIHMWDGAAPILKKIAIKNKTIPKNVKLILIASSDVTQAITSNEVDPNER